MYFRWIATNWYTFCKHPLTCFRTFFACFLVHRVKLKPIIKAQISEKLVAMLYKWCRDRFSTLWENPSEEVDYDNYYYESILRIDYFSRPPEIDFSYETKARKVILDFKFDALYS